MTWCRSAPLSPAAATRTSSSPFPGSGSGRSATTSRPSEIVTARTGSGPVRRGAGHEPPRPARVGAVEGPHPDGEQRLQRGRMVGFGGPDPAEGGGQVALGHPDQGRGDMLGMGQPAPAGGGVAPDAGRGGVDEALDQAAGDGLDVGVVAGAPRAPPPPGAAVGSAKPGTRPRWAASTSASWLAASAIARSRGPWAAYTSARRSRDSRPSTSGSPLPRSHPALIP